MTSFAKFIDKGNKYGFPKSGKAIFARLADKIPGAEVIAAFSAARDDLSRQLVSATCAAALDDGLNFLLTMVLCSRTREVREYDDHEVFVNYVDKWVAAAESGDLSYAWFRLRAVMALGIAFVAGIPEAPLRPELMPPKSSFITTPRSRTKKGGRHVGQE